MGLVRATRVPILKPGTANVRVLFKYLKFTILEISHLDFMC